MPHRDLRRLVCVMVVAPLAVMAASPARAQTTFTNRAAWAVAAGPHVTIDFEGIAPAGGSSNFPDGLTLSGVTFRGPGPGLLTVQSAGVGTYISSWGTGDMLVAPFGLGTTLSPAGSVSLPPGVVAVGFNYGLTCTITVGPICGQDPLPPWTVRLSTGAVFTLPRQNPPPSMAFWGVVNSVPIASLQIDPSASLTLIDNFSFQAPSIPALPPGGTPILAALLLLMALGSIGGTTGTSEEERRPR